MLLLAIIVAGGLRFWQLDRLPPGLYRDEAVNGLDAIDVLTGQRAGKSPFYFETNNGREPAYMYLTALSVFLFGRPTLAIRLAAAVVKSTSDDPAASRSICERCRPISLWYCAKRRSSFVISS